MGKILPILMAIIGVGAGIGAGITLKPEPVESENEGEHQAEISVDQVQNEPLVDDDGNDIIPEYVKMNNQFVIPVVKQGKMAALVVLSISIEVIAGGKEATFQREPKLRDAFNQVLFEHANAGGFDGVFTSSNKMIILRDSLYEIARKVAGPVVKDILIAEIVRQDV
ncbi:MAG TPA: flagellar basal body-associated protein FliL, partial [Rhodobacteraceae bacterium]|nr:flagellar basal body-associated protein FliL [Paracoccaceae bacterium]